MFIEDVKRARQEVKKLLVYMEDWLEADRIKKGETYANPAESGLVRAQSLIASRALQDMRNPWTERAQRNRRGRKKGKKND